MAKYWATCSICGRSFVALSPSANDCGRNDEQHIKAREGR